MSGAGDAFYLAGGLLVLTAIVLAVPITRAPRSKPDPHSATAHEKVDAPVI